MKYIILFFIALLTIPICSLAQSTRTNDSIISQIGSLGMERSISVSYDQPGNTTTIRAVGEYFSNREASSAGVQAINFGVGFYYPGAALASPAETVQLTFWIHTASPRFAESRDLKMKIGSTAVDLGRGRYTARPRQQMEYINFDIPRADLALISDSSAVVFRLGGHDLTLTKSHLTLLRALKRISGPDNDL